MFVALKLLSVLKYAICSVQLKSNQTIGSLHCRLILISHFQMLIQPTVRQQLAFLCIPVRLFLWIIYMMVSVVL